MHTIDPGPLTLARHPQTPSPAIHEIDVAVAETGSGSLLLSFCLVGDIAGLRIPESGTPGRADHLWQHTCFEAFVMAAAGPEYREFNLSPSGEWAVYDFKSYRNPGVHQDALENERSPAISVHRTMDRLELAAEITRDLLPHGALLRLGLSAVVEDADGKLSYWALRHPSARPDFHHPDAFALPLDVISLDAIQQESS